MPSISERSAGSCSRAPCHLTRRSISSGQLGLQLNADFSMEHFLSLNILLKIRIFFIFRLSIGRIEEELNKIEYISG